MYRFNINMSLTGLPNIYLSVVTFFNNCWFVICICCILLDELCLYYAFKNYKTFIYNLTNRLSKKNILYVKIFQAFALNNNIINQEIHDSLLKFTDNAPWDHKDIDMNSLIIFEKEFNIQILNDYMPINSGMISLVFKGKRNYGNEDTSTVIIKIKRKNIHANLQDGIQKMLFCIKLLSFIPIINNSNISDIVHNNIHLINQQTDFMKEVENMKIMKNNCKKLKYVIIPHVYEEVTNRFSNIILMDYIKGETLQMINPVYYDEYSKQVIKFVLVTMLMNGLCHGDLHMGNILFIKDDNDKKNKYKIGILDFGIIYEINKMKETFYYIFANMCNVSPEEMAQKLLTSGLIEPVECILNLEKNHHDKILLMLINFINDTFHVSKHFNQINIFKSLSELNDYVVNNNLKVNGLNIKPCDDLIKFQVVFTMLYSVLLKLCGDKYIETANKVMIELFHIDVSDISY
jgi:predicted unusual protein kinase regulating ubiquinone biosynthesis (AarF/ABC1/UbiB family)